MVPSEWRLILYIQRHPMAVLLGGRDVRDQVWLASNAASSDCKELYHYGMEAASVYERGSMS